MALERTKPTNSTPLDCFVTINTLQSSKSGTLSAVLTPF